MKNWRSSVCKVPWQWILQWPARGIISAKDLKSAGIELEQLRMSSRAIKHPCTRDAYRFSWFLNMIKKELQPHWKNHEEPQQYDPATICNNNYMANICFHGSSDLYFIIFPNVVAGPIPCCLSNPLVCCVCFFLSPRGGVKHPSCCGATTKSCHCLVSPRCSGSCRRNRGNNGNYGRHLSIQSYKV